MRQTTQFKLPFHDGEREITVTQNIVIVGANGAGKTRLGAWIEIQSEYRSIVHRISAQKSLSMPDSTSPIALQKAQSFLLYGYQDAGEADGFHYKSGHRWGNRPAISLLNDFDRLMIFLFSEHYEKSSIFLQAAKAVQHRVEPPETKIDITKKIWESILPHRELIIGGGTIKTKIRGSGDTGYNASEMSDGERVIFYLIGQCLAAPRNGIIVIDEPELHLHKSIQIPLWNELEQQRDDCLFVYITHDLDFSAAKESSAKIWLKSYNGAEWDWATIPQVEQLPEELLLEVIGSRKPVVFVEGENGSFDVALYRAILKGFLVIPVGSCSRVIQSVKALRENPQIHHMEIFGVIDRDRRVDTELQALERIGVFPLSVAEVENLFCTPEIINIVATKLEKDPAEVFARVQQFVLEKLNDELETQISLHCASEVRFKLNLFDDKAKGAEGLQNALTGLISAININAIYADVKSKFTDVITLNDYKEMLKLYNRKSLSSQIGKFFGFNNSELPGYVVRLAKGSMNSEITDALRPYFGNFSRYIV
ncbi:AAA family ATPase [Geomonas nitrogeniifigens]|uniref:AAA family ATPase n=1 Tax=Geomonas diazotrophica TaxID=2843197 RepID=A0ABX8JNC1_9BACT|nr:DUF4435 domain-containing protein [Geomonas nitrogeniifigens]QWV98656.1 AAA family ATPase [Geomonas nitrogeniifigens]